MGNRIQKSRTHNAIANSLVGIFSALVTVVLNFVVRVVVVRELGAEINGLHNLFTSITTFVTLIEAGFSTAMVIFLYKPIQEKDQPAIHAIMAFYQKIYRMISWIVLGVSILVDVFLLPFLVHSSMSIWKVRGYYTIYMLMTPLQFLTYHKISILYAEQNNRLYAMARTVSELVFRSLQILTVIVTHEYYWFVVLLIFEKLAVNFYCSRNVDRRYPFLNKKCENDLSKEQKKKVYDKVKPIFISNLASNVQGSSQSILISFLLGNISIVGVFGNYQLVTSTARLIFSQFGAALTSSFGNLSVEGNKEHLYAAYRKTAFVLNWFAILLCGGFISCIQPFIAMCFGQNFLLSLPNVILLTSELFIYLLSIPVISVQNALGLHKKDQNVMVFQAVVSVFLGYILGKACGMAGILLGLLIPQFFCTLLNKGVAIFKTAFARTAADFLSFSANEMMKGAATIACSMFITSFIKTGFILLDFLLSGVTAVIVTTVCFFFFSAHSPYFKEIMDLTKQILRRK